MEQTKVNIGEPSAKVGAIHYYTVKDLVVATGLTYATITARANTKGIVRDIMGRRVFTKAEADSIVNDTRPRGRPVGTGHPIGPRKAKEVVATNATSTTNVTMETPDTNAVTDTTSATIAEAVMDVDTDGVQQPEFYN